MMGERRQKPRADVHLKVELSLAGDMEKRYAFIRDLSEGGMCVTSFDNYPIGSKVCSGFTVSPREEKLFPMATVIHSRYGNDAMYSYGLKFDFLREREQETLKGFLANKTK